MFYIVEIKDYVRVEPKLFGFKTSDSVARQLQETYMNYQNTICHIIKNDIR